MQAPDDSMNLADREARLRAILETSVEGIITINERGTIESMNPAAEQLFGYASAEAVGQNITLFMPSPYREEHDGYLAAYLKSGVKKIIGIGRDVTGRRKDGSTFPLHLAVSEVPLSTGRIFTGFIHDLTERVAAEQDLRRLAALIEDSHDAITLQEFDGKIVDWNRGAERMYGYTAEEAIGKNILELVPQARRAQSRAFRARLAAGQQSDSFETQRVTKEGRVIDVWLTATALLDPNGEPTVVATTERDVTERNRMREELERLVQERTNELQHAHQELVRKERLAVLGQLAGGVAHEIRNPLGVIRNAIYFLREMADVRDEDVIESFEEIERALFSSDHIVGELLDYAREPQSNHVTFPAEQALEHALATLKLPSSVRVKREQVRGLLCNGDAGQIERILTNLISNALHAMPQGGDLSLEIRSEDDFVVFEVADTGSGIAEADLPRIFDPLFTRRAKGIGLGLAISKRYAELNQGEIQVESTPGVGTRFRLMVPRAVSA